MAYPILNQITLDNKENQGLEPLTLSLTRLVLASGSLLFAGWCLFLASDYVELHRLTETISGEKALSRSALPGPGDSLIPFENYSEALTGLSMRQPGEAEIPYLQASLALHKLQIARVGGENNVPEFFNAFITRIHALQPTHYQAFALTMANAPLTGQPVTAYHDLLRTWLPLAPNEEEVQINAGSYLIAHWEELPADIKELALPVIQSGLRQQPVKRILIQAMKTHNVIRPFLKISPDRATTAKLKAITGNPGTNQ